MCTAAEDLARLRDAIGRLPVHLDARRQRVVLVDDLRTVLEPDPDVRLARSEEQGQRQRPLHTPGEQR